ncbi:UNVERIFIED_CONTAM: Transposon Ty3-G Gag-Pol polyprotein [Sesamum latifolium]|uniref:Transposon Ty3-G Gag-Pol polyprotein n=1 Tax=Sesamum latifolium TaxID=2727402 RepID=A0AAW2Y5C2_9LAMI
MGEVRGDQLKARECRCHTLRQLEQENKEPRVEKINPADGTTCFQLENSNREIKIGANLSSTEKEELVRFLQVFEWEEEKATGIPEHVVQHRLRIHTNATPVKQKDKHGQREESDYTSRSRKAIKSGTHQGDFTDLNKACPKDPYPLPRIDQLVDSTAGCERLSMLDAYQGYNQIKLAKEDQEKTSFITERGLYCYNVMPFGLKNAGATYQMLVNKIFSEQIGRNIEVYVDDILVKSKERQQHTKDLKECFDQLRKYGVKLNPQKCTFGVEGGKFLGYLVTQRGIEANPDKITAIQQMKEPRSIKEVQQLADECSRAFKELKSYLEKPPLLSKPEDGERIWIYLALSNEATSTVLAKESKGIAKENGVRRIRVHCDSQLVVGQVAGGYEAKDDRMKKLMQKARDLLSTFQKWELIQISRNVNNLADTLARMGGHMENINDPQVTLLLKATEREGNEVTQIEARQAISWMDAIRKYLEHEQLPAETLEARCIKRLSTRFFIEGGHLFKKSFTLPALRCLIPEEAWKVMKEIHEGCCGNHAGGRSLAQKNLKTKLGDSRTGWVEEIPGVLWAYRTTPRTSTGETPFSLVYGSEALIPAEVVEPTQRVLSYEEHDNHEARHQDLDLIEEQRNIARMRLENYKRRILRSYNSRVKERTLQIGDLVLRKVEVQKPVEKLEPK